MKINLLAQFNKRYTGVPADGEAICEEIAKDFGLDAEEVKDFVYCNRYAAMDDAADALDEEVFE